MRTLKIILVLFILLVGQGILFAATNKSTYCLVWPEGGDSNFANGGATSAYVDANGRGSFTTSTGRHMNSVASAANGGCNITSNGGLIRLTSVAAGGFSEAGNSCETGMIAYFESPSHTNGFYEITKISADVIDLIGSTWAANETSTLVRVGGALSDLETAGSIDLTVADTATQRILFRGGQVTFGGVEIVSGGTGWFRVFIIGVDANLENHPVGSYGTLEAVDGLGLGTALMLVTGDQVTVQGIYFYNNGGGGGGSGANDHGIKFDGDRGSTINCAVSNCFSGILNSAAAIIHTNPVLFDNKTAATTGGIGVFTVYGGLLKNNSTGAFKTSGSGGCHMYGVVIDGNGNSGHFLQGSGPTSVINCTFWNMGTYCIRVNNAALNAQFINNSFHVVNPVFNGDYVIWRESGHYEEIVNITNAPPARAGFQNLSQASGSVTNLAFTNTDPWVNAAGGNFKPNRGQPIADNYVINKGFVPYFNSTTSGNEATIGAYQMHVSGEPSRRARHQGEE